MNVHAPHAAATTNEATGRLIAGLVDNVRAAVDSTKSAYGRMTNGKTPAKALLEDKKLQADLRGEGAKPVERNVLVTPSADGFSAPRSVWLQENNTRTESGGPN